MGVFITGGRSEGQTRKGTLPVAQAAQGWPQPAASVPAQSAGEAGLQLSDKCAQHLLEPDPGDKEMTFDL